MDATNVSDMTASELWAISNNSKCEGDDRCYWCGAAAKRDLWRRPNPPVMLGLGTQNPQRARCPGNSWICNGCNLFARERITVKWLPSADPGSPAFRDGQDPATHSWWVTDEGCWGIAPWSWTLLWANLLNPPRRFSLALLDGGNVKNMLHLWAANDVAELNSYTELRFTINNIPHSYSVYDLEEAVRSSDPMGRSPGIIALFRILGVPNGRIEKRGPGRPRLEDDPEKRPRRPIAKSGVSDF